MSNQEQPKKETKMVSKPIPPHVCGFALSKSNPDFIIKGKRTICMKPTAKIIPEKPGMAFPDYGDQVDMQKIVDSYVEETGLAYAMRQINAGRLMPTQLNDKGDAGVDLTGVADNVNDAQRQAMSAAQGAKKVAEALGIDRLDPAHIEEVVTRIVNERIAAQQAASKSEGETK